SFRQHQGEAAADLLQPKLVDRPSRGQQQGYAEAAKPQRLVKMRKHLESEGTLARRSAQNLRTNDEPVMTLMQAVVVNHAPRHCLRPFRIETFEDVRITDPFGRAEMDGGEADLHAPVSRRDLHGPAEIDLAMIIGHHLDEIYQG